MKRIVSMVILIILLAGCSNSNISDREPTSTISMQYEVKERYYEIHDITKHERPLYQYYIFNGNHEVVDYGIIYAFPKVTKSGSIIKLCIQVAEHVICCRYIDIEEGCYSYWFTNPVAENETMVVYTDQGGATKLIIQDIFDKSKYYREFERDFAYKQWPLVSAKFISDGKQLRVKYITREGGYYKEITETLDLT